MEINVKVPAKINLALDITGKNKDSYHTVKMVMQSVSLYDEIEIKTNNSKEIDIFSDKEIDTDPTQNTAFKAAKEFFEYSKITNPGLEIFIKKNIPIKAGLAGGSADAAGVILCLNKMYNTQFSESELKSLTEKIGADVPFCLFGGTMLATGIGTDLTPLPDLADCHIVLSKPSVGISTKEAYKKFDNHKYSYNHDINDLISGIESHDIKKISKLIFNKFEYVLDINDVNVIKNVMNNSKALGSCMSGSGPTVFGIFDDYTRAKICSEELKKTYKETFLCKPVKGPIIEFFE